MTRSRQRSCDKAEESRDGDSIDCGGLAITSAQDEREKTYSNTLEYSSCLAAKSWMMMRMHPRGNEIRQSMNDPLKLTLQIDAEHIPPKNISCHLL